ncbi:P-loop containing nucleoside triphosphate hydrolase protein, partial [Mycena amicta]
MMWFADTFDKSLSRSQVEDALARSIGDVIQDIWDNLTHPIRARLNYAQNPLEKVQILFGHLDSQSGNAVLVHAFQHALLKWGGIDYMLNSLRDSTIQDEIVFIRNCPPPSEFFQGRKDVLQQLDHLFQQTEHKEQKSVLLYGLGGAGKTQIALKFIADSGSRFTDQFKINASSAETIEAGYRQLAIDKKLGDTVEAARTWLKANEQEWLILFDNADKRDLNLGPYLPKYQHGNILITSRNPDLGIHTGLPRKAIQISDLAVDDASVLLLNRAGVELETGDNQKHAAMIAKELHCFPLAIVQAGAFIDKSPRLKQDISRYVQLYQKNKAVLLSKKSTQFTEDYNENVYTTWKISFDQISQLEPLAAQFLQLCSFMHFEGISEDIFERASTYKIKNGPLDPTLEVLESSFEFLSKFRDADMTWNSLVFENIASELCGYSLMTWQKGAYSIHPLVHQWSRTTIMDLIGLRKLMI